MLSKPYLKELISIIKATQKGGFFLCLVVGYKKSILRIELNEEKYT